jgi:hypothetical protein
MSNSLPKICQKKPVESFLVKTVEVKDPIVFQFCKGDICRIITKWGTSDDQSYLDPLVINETMN